MSALNNHFVRLFAHLAWADDMVLQSLRSARTIVKPIMDLHSHIIGSEHVWLSRTRGVAPQLAVWPILTLDECEKWASENAQGFNAAVKDATDESLQRAITYRNSAGDQYTSSLEDILTHVALHGSYHRAQIAAALRGSGETPAPTDYIAFARGAPAATRR